MTAVMERENFQFLQTGAIQIIIPRLARGRKDKKSAGTVVTRTPASVGPGGHNPITLLHRFRVTMVVV